MSRSEKFSYHLQKYFSDYLIEQRNVSQNTVASYRDTFKLLIEYCSSHIKKSPDQLKIDDVDAGLVKSFLTHLQKTRKCSVRSRNQRLSVLKSFFKYLSYNHPQKSDLIAKVLSVPMKKYESKTVEYLTKAEVKEILKSCNQETWTGQRDCALIYFLVQTGLRVSEAAGLKESDLQFGKSPNVYCKGKGRKERRTPLTKETIKLLKAWLKNKSKKKSDYLFPNNRGEQMSASAIQALLRKYAGHAEKKCPSLKKKNVTPHVLRHTTAVDLLNSGVDISVISLWLGHESVETSHIYLSANLDLKEKALQKVTPVKKNARRFKPSANLLAYLEQL